MKKTKILMLLAAAQYQPQEGDKLCRGDRKLGTQCGKCPRCEWDAKRQEALTDHL